jgi:hypothetical protein
LSLRLTGHKTINLLVPFWGEPPFAILGVGLAPVAACDVRGNCVGRGRKQRPTSEEKADPGICKEERAVIRCRAYGFRLLSRSSAMFAPPLKKAKAVSSRDEFGY